MRVKDAFDDVDPRRWAGRGWKALVVAGAVGVLVTVIASIATGMTPVRPPAPTIDADGSRDLATIDRYVEDEMDAQRIPGLALAIVEGNRVVHVRGFGRADESGRRVTPQTLFFNGSTTKAFIALAVMQLHEAGRLDLDAPVQRYLPWWRVADVDASARITVRHLLYQVSGLSKGTGNAHATSSASNPSALEEQVRELRSVELTDAVGAAWQYSNANYNTLGLIVQVVSGQPYETYVREHVLLPLDMRNSALSVAEAKPKGLVTGYRYWFGQPVAAELPFNRGNAPAGGLISSVEDMSHYLIAQLNEGRYGTESIVSAEGMAELQRVGVPTGHDGTSYAMGWEVRETNGIRVLSHDGSTFNSHANVVLVPDAKLGIVLFENAENSPDEFFGARRMSGIADGITSLLAGKRPEAAGSTNGLRIVYATTFSIVALQIATILRSARRLRRWRREPHRRPHGVLRVALALGRPAAQSVVWAVVVLVALPDKVQAPLSALLIGLPDLGCLLVASVALGSVWNITRIVWTCLIVRSTPAVAAPGVVAPSRRPHATDLGGDRNPPPPLIRR